MSATVGLGLGVGGYTFVYAKGASYLGNDPRTCANCHVMQAHYDGWLGSSHHAAATCNDCHNPPGLVSKYMTKASNGFWHSLGFTTGRFPEPLRIKPNNRRIVEDSCRRCHQDIVDAIDPHGGGDQRLSCVSCHEAVGHGGRE